MLFLSTFKIIDLRILNYESLCFPDSVFFITEGILNKRKNFEDDWNFNLIIKHNFEYLFNLFILKKYMTRVEEFIALAI